MMQIHRLWALITVLFLTGVAVASEADKPMIQNTISNQIAAFKADDFAKAFTFASPSIQRMFRTPENFGAMVRNGYPMVWRPQSVQFGELREISGALWQQVLVQDAAGQVFALDYRMIEIDGDWRISGVQILPAPDMSA